MLAVNFKLKRLSSAMIVFLFFFAPLVYPQDYGDAFVSGSIADARNLVPILASDSASAEICSLVFNGLVKYDKDINIVPDLAEGWTIEAGGRVIIFFLRKNVLWHDGHAFTAHDVEFTYQKLIDPRVKTPYSGDFERIESLKLIDDYTIKITYKDVFAPALASWGMSIMPKHLLEKEDLNKTAFSRSPIGTGPYKFKSWNTQEKIELVRNQHYFDVSSLASADLKDGQRVKKRPFIDRYIYRIIPDQSTLFLELQVQGVDNTGLSPLQYIRQTDTAYFRKNYQKFRIPSFGYVYLGYNLNDAKFKDKLVRQALNYAVDKAEIIKIALLGLGKISTGPFLPQSWAYNDKVEAYAYDPQKAKQLLRLAGWQDSNGDGWLDKAGKIFEFSVITNQGNEERIKTLEIIQRRLKDIGVKVNIRVLEWSVFLTEFIEKKNFEAVLLGWSLARDPDCFDIWHSSSIKEGGFNFVGYKNEEVDQLLSKARATFEQMGRQAYYQNIQKIIYDDQPYMFLYVPESLLVLHRRFRGVRVAPIGIGYNFIDWWVPQREQRYRR